uniref:Membrane-associated kinase regulator 1 n=1 Tax=Kalanchoe fedtschenkoi TaxID=63787 RepID=A0A7N0SYI8_KALFE
MGRSRAPDKARFRSHTLPSSPSHSSSSSDFEFRICSSPPNNATCPADDLFYKGKLLPLHLSPRLSMVRTLLLASSSTSSSSDTTTSASRDSSGSSSSSDAALFADYNCDSSRPSSVADFDDEFIKRPLNAAPPPAAGQPTGQGSVKKTTTKYFSLAKFSSVFKKEPRTSVEPNIGGAASNSVKRMSASARDVFRKYMKKVKPLYEKLSSQKQKIDEPSLIPDHTKSDESVKPSAVAVSHSFSGNLRYPRRKGVMVSSCPSSMRSSPCHSGVLTRTGFPIPARTCPGNGGVDSSMEELQNAIQGAIAHCKNSMLQNKSGPLVSNEL